MYVKPKKFLGQHFLTDQNIASKIVSSINYVSEKPVNCLEIGAGTGVLTQFLINRSDLNSYFFDVDSESIEYLKNKFPQNKNQILYKDFLTFDLQQFEYPIVIIGNFPYNISSQILFKILENKNKVVQVVGMLQKEVAERIASKEGNKNYGILSVFLQAFFTIDKLFDVSENVFNPPPKVKSAVIRMNRNNTLHLNCDENIFFQVVKTAFNQRRKTLRNSLKSYNIQNLSENLIFSKRPEQLTYTDFVFITNLITNK